MHVSDMCTFYRAMNPFYTKFITFTSNELQSSCMQCNISYTYCKNQVRPMVWIFVMIYFMNVYFFVYTLYTEYTR